MDDEYERRKKLTFEEAEGLVPLPSQLQPRQLTQHLRAGLWAMLYRSIARSTYRGVLSDDWHHVMERLWVVRDGLAMDEYSADAEVHIQRLKKVVMEGSYGQVFGLFQWLLRQRECREMKLGNAVQIVLEHNRAAYRVMGGDTIVPISSEAEAATLKRAFADVASTEYSGARTHLQRAAEALTAGKLDDTVRESIQAVESVARVLTGENTFAAAITKFEKRWAIHPALKAGMLRVYDYTSDEQGVRHALINAGHSPVDEADALFMLGACASMVSYLINKARGSSARVTQ